MSFVREGDQVLVELDAFEVRVLGDLLGQALALIEPEESEEPAPDAPAPDPLAEMVGIGTEVRPPADPALARLFPDAYRDDATAAGDFRRFTEARLRARKVGHAQDVLRILGLLAVDAEEAEGSAGAGDEIRTPVALDDQAVSSWLGALNDLRLLIGTRLGVEEDDDPAEWLDGPDGDAYRLYHWLGFLQDDLLAAVVADPG